MKKTIVVVGLGEMGSVFARGFLRSGYCVQPVVRGMSMQTVAESTDLPELVIIAVGEADLQAQLQQVPEQWKDRLLLLQNELLPADWQKHKLEPSVISVWFEKKKGQDSKVIMPSPVYGKAAALVEQALSSIDIAVHVLASEEALLNALVIKNVYILTTNIAGLMVAGNVGQCWQEHRELATGIANDVISLQEALTGESFHRADLIEGMVEAFNGDPEHMCMGRSAPARLKRALSLATEHGLELPHLLKVAQQHINNK